MIKKGVVKSQRCGDLGHNGFYPMSDGELSEGLSKELLKWLQNKKKLERMIKIILMFSVG